MQDEYEIKEDLINSQAAIQSELERFQTNFKKDGKDRKSSLDYLNAKLATLQTLYGEFKSNNLQLSLYHDQSEDYYESRIFEKVKSEFELTYQMVKSMVTAAQAAQVAEAAQPAKSESASNQNVSNPQATFSKSDQGSENPKGKAQGSENTKEKGTESKIDELLKKQNSHFRAFTKTVQHITYCLVNASEKWELTDLLTSLQSRWTAIDTLHLEIDSELEGSNLKYEAKYSETEETFNTYKRAINQKMWSVSHKELATPTMEIPTFTGTYQQWVSFKDLFTEAIHNNKSISNAQKMQHLKSKVKGEAEKLIQHLKISSENYQICWEILNKRYNNKKMIFNSHVDYLLNLPNMKYQSAAYLKKIHDTANECLNAIKNLGVNTSTWDPFIVHILSQKKPSHNSIN